MAASTRKGDVATLLTALLVFLIAGSVSGEAQAPQAGARAEAPSARESVSLAAKSASGKSSHNGEGSGSWSVLIGGANAFASPTTDGTGNGMDSTGGNNNGNNNTGNGNGNGNGNNNAIITIQNDPTFLTCPPCQYYDPSQQLCITVQTCVANKPTPSPSPAVTSGAAGTAPVTVADAAPASGAKGVVTSTAGRRRLLEPWGQRLAPFW